MSPRRHNISNRFTIHFTLLKAVRCCYGNTSLWCAIVSYLYPLIYHIYQNHLNWLPKFDADSDYKYGLENGRNNNTFENVINKVKIARIYRQQTKVYSPVDHRNIESLGSSHLPELPAEVVLKL